MASSIPKRASVRARKSLHQLLSIQLEQTCIMNIAMIAYLLITRNLIQKDLDLHLTAGEDQVSPPESLIKKFLVKGFALHGIVIMCEVCRCGGLVLGDLLAAGHGPGTV